MRRTGKMGFMISNENEPQLDPRGRALAKITPGSGSHHVNESLPAGFEL